jgi:hypothetical protein
MRTFRLVLTCLLMSAGGLSVLMPANAASTGSEAPHPGRIVSDNPSGYTPNVIGRKVQTLARVARPRFRTVLVGDQTHGDASGQVKWPPT